MYNPMFPAASSLGKKGASLMRLKLCVFVLSTFAILAGRSSEAQTYSVLHKFAGYPTDGAMPFGDMVQDSAGNLYGTTLYGGLDDRGTVFKIDSLGNETVLYNFSRSAPANGLEPVGGLFRDPEGAIYGTTVGGGEYGYGTIFKLDTSNNLTVLHSFDLASAGRYPSTRLVPINGTLYGTTEVFNCIEIIEGGCGVIYSLNSVNRYSVIYGFTDEADGASPGDLVRDADGNLYGDAYWNGVNLGTIFKVDMSGNFSILYAFNGETDGSAPYGRLLIDGSGVIHGVAHQLPDGASGGEVFRLDATGNFSIVHKFLGVNKGQFPEALLDVGGKLYGTTYAGGANLCSGIQQCGVFFVIGKTGQYSVLHDFDTSNGWQPFGALTLGIDGGIYGTTEQGGIRCPTFGTLNTCGIVFKYTP